MFFHERPDDFFPYARIEVVDKPNPTGIGMTEKIFAGRIRQVKNAYCFCLVGKFDYFFLDDVVFNITERIPQLPCA